MGVGQMSEKTNFAPFRNIVNAYFCLYVLCFFLSLFLGGWVTLIPFLLVWAITINLRIHVARFYNIRGGCFQEFLTAFFCIGCSVAQMARHIYGYTKVYDGDSDPYVHDYYGVSGNINSYAGTGHSGPSYAGSNYHGGVYGNQQVIRNQGAMVV